MKQVSRMIALLVLLGLTIGPSPKLLAQGVTVVPVGIAGLNNNTIHSYVSRDMGLFRKYGVDARLVVFQAGSLLAQASMAGEVKISMVAGPVTIASRSAGSDSVIIGALINTLPYKMIVAKGITRSDELKGKKIGISRFGSSTDTAVRLLLASSRRENRRIASQLCPAVRSMRPSSAFLWISLRKSKAIRS
jgi:ABC-type nitrate/sulfonate/bicarbonate transport system substrate-binding protein